MLEIGIAAVLIENAVEILKELGLKGYSKLLSVLVGIIVAVAANVQILPIEMIDNAVSSQIISGIILGGGSNYVNAVRDKLGK
ncbi:MAG TPA: hypothetical protein ENH82_03950 [bacterium]|nr:hypothetical protein [bacterium]